LAREEEEKKLSSSSSESKKLHEEAILDSCVTFTFFGVGGSGSLQATRRAATSFSSSSIGISIPAGSPDRLA
jgi:hypothetical protein